MLPHQQQQQAPMYAPNPYQQPYQNHQQQAPPPPPIQQVPQTPQAPLSPQHQHQNQQQQQQQQHPPQHQQQHQLPPMQTNQPMQPIQPIQPMQPMQPMQSMQPMHPYQQPNQQQPQTQQPYQGQQFQQPLQSRPLQPLPQQMQPPHLPQQQQPQNVPPPQQFHQPPPPPHLGHQNHLPPSMPTGPAAHYPYGQSHNPQPAPPKIDQHAMPSAAQLISDEIETYKKTDRQLKFTSPASLPPLVTTLESNQLKMIQQDGGCARPCHMRSTLYQIPLTKDLLDSSGLDFAVVIKPFDDSEVQGQFYTPLSSSQISRCNRCKAYANPFSRNAQCCICNYTTEIVQEVEQKPELCYGSYEFRVGPEYYRDSIAETRRPHIIFAIEMTVHSRHLVHFISNNLADIIKNNFPSDFLYSTVLCPLVGFATYNSKITLYDVKDGGHAYVMSDMTAVTDCASISKFLVDPNENFEEIEKFLGSLAELCEEQSTVEQQTVLGPVVEAVLKTCRFDTSNNFQGDGKKIPNQKVIPTGKVYLLHSSLPTYGDDTTPGRLGTKRNIDDMKRQLGTESESKVLGAEGKYYTQLAQKCINDYGSGVELFLFPPHPAAYLNIGTLGELTRLTGTGVIHKYHLSSLENFVHDLKVSLKSTVAFDASIRVRTSTGISPTRYIGNFNNTVGSNLEMSAVNTSSNFIVQMKYDDKLPENDLVVVQFAMIYTSVCGERRVRVHNLALSTCQILADLYKSACCDTIVNVLLRDTIDKMRSHNLAPRPAKEQLTQRVINILAAYRKHCTENHSGTSSQLILPEGLKLLPVYLCGALKCDAIDGGMELFPDDKVLAQLNLLGALPSQSQATVYPRMYYIQACDADDETNESGMKAVLTRCYNLAIEEDQGQCYLLENGYYLFIFFPKTAMGQSFLANMYGARQNEPNLSWDMRMKESNEATFIEELIGQIVAERRRALKISIVRQGVDKLENVFRTFLYEDKKRTDGIAAASKFDNAAYVDILCYLHQEIRAKLSQ